MTVNDIEATRLNTCMDLSLEVSPDLMGQVPVFAETAGSMPIPEYSVDGFEEPPYLRELDQAVDRILDRRPNGRSIFIKQLLKESVGGSKLPQPEFLAFFEAVSAHVRITKLGKGAYMIGGISISGMDVQPENGDNVIPAKSLEHMLSIWRKTSPRQTNKPFSRRRNHFKRFNLIDGYNPED